MADLVALLDQMWDEKLLHTSQTGAYYRTHPTMRGNWKDAEAIKNQIRKELQAPTPPTPDGFNFETGNYGDKYFGQEVVSAIKRLFSRG